MYKAYLFDWDGTLADTLDIWLQAHRDIFAHFGIDFPGFTDYEKVLADINFESSIIPASDPAYIQQRYDQVAKDIAAYAQFIPQALELINALKSEGSKVAVITSSGRRQIESILKRHNLLNLFDILICAEDTLKHKPDPEPLLQALKELKVNKQEAVMVGDTYYDITAGKAAGLDTILFHHPGLHDKYYDLSDQVVQNPPTYVVANLMDILKL